MTDLHATAAALICDVHDGHRFAALATLRRMTQPELIDLAVILAHQADVDEAIRPIAQTLTTQQVIDICIEKVRAAYELPLGALQSHSRERDVTQARHLACWIAFESGATYAAIGRTLNRDHSTVMHAVRKVQNSHALLAMARTIRDGTRDTGAA